MQEFKPKGFSAVTPFLAIEDLAGFIDFAEQGLGAEITTKMDHGDGKIIHAEFKIDDCHIMAGDTEDGSYPGNIYVYVQDCDKAFDKAVSAGAEVVSKPKDQFYGDRNGVVKDKWGNQWWFATLTKKN